MRRPPIPREEPEDFREEPTTLRPPPDGASEDEVATYQKLRDSCRVAASTPKAEEAVTDDELAIEAEVLRIAMERGTQRPKA